MSEILFQYQKINPTTWVYLSSLLMIGLYFQFNRFWSVRNLDLVLLILLSPGLLMVNQAREGTQLLPATVAAIEPDQQPGVGETATATPTVASSTATTVPGAAARINLARVGYIWLFAMSGVWLVRMLLDPTMIRRPLLEPNATKGCLVFLGCSLFVFLMANVITSDPTPDDIKAVQSAH